ncbi:MAG: aminopeptidase N C-terminal domain-containing protein, partial [Pseudomonadota bacterium]
AIAREIHQLGSIPDPDAIYAASKALADAQAEAYADILPALYEDHLVTDAYAPDADQSGKRALSNSALGLLSRTDGGACARSQFERADNMTQQLSALACVIKYADAAPALAQFGEQWGHDRLVMDKWFGMQPMLAKPEDAVAVTQRLTQHAAFNWKNPNRFRAVLGAFGGNHAGFHSADGSGYALMADWLIKLDPLNPQTTARMCSVFQSWRRYDDARQAHMQNALERIAATAELSRDTTEMVTRILDA